MVMKIYLLHIIYMTVIGNEMSVENQDLQMFDLKLNKYE